MKNIFTLEHLEHVFKTNTSKVNISFSTFTNTTFPIIRDLETDIAYSREYNNVHRETILYQQNIKKVNIKHAIIITVFLFLLSGIFGFIIFYL